MRPALLALAIVGCSGMARPPITTALPADGVYESIEHRLAIGVSRAL